MSDSGTATAPKLRHGIAEEVRVLLARRRMSATRLALDLGWTQQYLSRRMVGDQPFDADDMEAIAGALGVEPQDLMPRRQRGSEPTQPYRGIGLRVSGTHALPDHPIVIGATPLPPSGVRRTAPAQRAPHVVNS